jgi:hypothetical protein
MYGCCFDYFVYGYGKEYFHIMTNTPFLFFWLQYRASANAQTASSCNPDGAE